ncbi:JmjC domain-containing protein [Hyalangium rubrum]|nr:cupin domain-containing protein [Hyalangium sp. s54d21]
MTSAPPIGWKNFIARYWRKAPVHFPAAFRPGLLSPDEGFEIFATASRATAEKPGSRVPLHFFTGKGFKESDPRPFLPLADKSLEAYTQRLATQLPGQNFVLALNHAEAWNDSLWLRCRTFLQELYEGVGIPENTDLVFWLSRAGVSGFGVHNDPFDHLIFVLTGRKRFLLWPTDIIRAHPEVVNDTTYLGIRDQSLIVDLEPGDMLYIPQGYYHVVEGDNQPCFQFSLAITSERMLWLDWFRGSMWRAQEPQLREVPASMTIPLIPPQGGEVTAPLPEHLEQLTHAFSGIGSSMRLQVARGWLARLTSLGLGPPQERDTRAITDDDTLQGDSDNPILLYALGDSLVGAARGHSFVTRASEGVQALVERLNSGQRWRVGALLDEQTATWHWSASDRAEAHQLLTQLHRVRALELGSLLPGAVD